LDNFGNLLFAIATDNHFRNLAIETGICTPAKGTQLVGTSIKEMKLDIQPILAGSSIEPSGPISEGW
ncbi:MAG: hypothetical protein II670_12890, partial [Alphaproteobacteria bacterium]|nr:hypothetical protein [Alphaproteobacteria bacterium]